MIDDIFILLLIRRRSTFLPAIYIYFILFIYFFLLPTCPRCSSRHSLIPGFPHYNLHYFFTPPSFFYIHYFLLPPYFFNVFSVYLNILPSNNSHFTTHLIFIRELIQTSYIIFLYFLQDLLSIFLLTSYMNPSDYCSCFQLPLYSILFYYIFLLFF